MMEKIIVIGTGWSGSGAVFDYLAGRRKDVIAPLGDTEFRIVADPGGLFLLHNTIKYSFSIHNADNAVKDFLRLCRDLNRRLSFKDSFIPISLVEQFIKNITVIEYRGTPDYEVKKLGRMKKFLVVLKRNHKNRRGNKALFFPMYYLVDEHQFIKESIKFIDAILYHNRKDVENVKYSVINHGGTFWNPVTSTQFYGDRKVVLVTRDPRDVFVEIHARGNAYPGDDVQTFCTWYKDMMRRVSESEHNDGVVIRIRFERFVTHYMEEKGRLDSFLGLDTKMDSTYNPEESKKNIGKYLSVLSKREISLIEHELEEFIIS